MERADYKFPKKNLICLILCAVFALAALACAWTSRTSGVFESTALRLGGTVINVELIPLAVSALYVLCVLLSGLLHKNRGLRIAFSALSCLIAASWLIPLGGMKTQALAKAFIHSNGKGIALAIEYLRNIFLIAVHVLMLLDAIKPDRRKSLQLESFLLHSALVFFVSSILLSMFTSPAYPEPAKFVGFKYWGEFFQGILKLSPTALNAFDISSASVFPVYDGAVLLALFSAVLCCNTAFRTAAKQKAGQHAQSYAKPVRRPTAHRKPLANAQISNDTYEQLQALAAYRRKGMITDEEFYRRKRKLLEG